VKLRSLRARLVVGALVWSLALILAGMLGGGIFIRFHPRWTAVMHYSFMMFIGAVLVTAGISVMRRVLLPFDSIRERLAAVREGRTARLDGEYPTEVTPLVTDLNTLLAEREQRVARAVARAGDLAHGLKTPLAILAQDVDRAEHAGQHDLAASMRQQVERMRRQVDSNLAQARATASGAVPGACASVAAAAHALGRTMARLHAARALTIDVDHVPDVAVRVPMEDLEEMLGNLLDNGCKWAASRVSVSASTAGGVVTIDVDDDGAGLEPPMRKRVLQRGVRGDEAASGSGLGLAIVRDLADAYSGSIALEPSPAGGVRARLRLPAM
jgi:signal transduction histidine kinase